LDEIAKFDLTEATRQDLEYFVAHLSDSR
jgi:hypothetical protein